MQHIFWRIVLDLVLIASVLFFPWWCTLALALVLMVVYGMYEALCAGFFIDALYGGTQGAFLHTLLFLISAGGAWFLRTRLVWHHEP